MSIFGRRDKPGIDSSHVPGAWDKPGLPDWPEVPDEPKAEVRARPLYKGICIGGPLAGQYMSHTNSHLEVASFRSYRNVVGYIKAFGSSDVDVWMYADITYETALLEILRGYREKHNG